MSISLIANSGVQFYKFNLAIDPNQDVLNSVGFYEFRDQLKDIITLQYAYYLPETGNWVPKNILRAHDYLEDDERLKDNINYQLLKGFVLKEGQENGYYTLNDIVSCLEVFVSRDYENKWLPIPYFKQNTNGQSLFGPIAWARMMLRPIPAPPEEAANKKSKKLFYKVILAFDTETAAPREKVYYAPKEEDTVEDDNSFAFCTNENLFLNFCDNNHDCEWVERFIRSVVKEEKDPHLFPRLRYLAVYLYFLKYLERLGEFPVVRFFSDKQPAIDVDLVLDIGNSNTCGLLFETSDPKKPFHFNSVKKLKLNDLTQPENDYSEPFSMRLAFVEAKFGEIDIPEHKNFRWPSLLRLGPEAARLINSHTIKDDRHVETASHHSSPKRYLWDTNKAEIQWEFINFKGSNLRDAIYYEGISEQFTETGEFAYEGNFGSTPYYSRQSLMSFVYMEIIVHAISQINSFEFRNTHSNLQKPRKLRRITITCPTAIIQQEQVILRECAIIATRALRRFFSNNFLGQFDAESEDQGSLEIIPKPKDLSRNLDRMAERKDWIYDEATCSQFVFLYGEIAQRYLNNAPLFFDLYGKKRNDVKAEDRKALTIGSIDIGGGTTDLMICSYQYQGNQKPAKLEPLPLYWESFNLAGDDLLKEIVQQIVLEGVPANKDEEGCTGVIANSARQKGVTNVAGKMLHFFGTDYNPQGYMATVYRKNFIVQVAIPIAQRYLEHAIGDGPDREVGFDDLFPTNKPNKELLAYFNEQFKPLVFESIRWKLSRSRVGTVVETSFDPMIKLLSTIVAAYGCDFVLLAGKPTTIPKIRELFIKYYPVSPDRLISMNAYRVGRWYPFVDNFGNINDPKTVVSVGALIALMGGKLEKLDGFRLDTGLLKRKLVSTSDYMGSIDPYTQQIDTLYLAPEENVYEIVVHSLPLKIGYKQLPNLHYRGKPIYKLELNENELRRRVLEQYPTAGKEADILAKVESMKSALLETMPFSVKIRRNIRENKEVVTIDKVLDGSRNERSKSLFSLRIMTLPDEYGYWLDTGAFILNLK